MKSIRNYLTLAALLVAIVSPANAQLSLADLQSKLLGSSWLSTVEGENRTRTLVVSTVEQKAEGSFGIVGTYNFSDAKPARLKDGEILISSGNIVLSFTSVAGSFVTADAKPDGTFVGTIKYTNGQVKPIKFEKGAVGVAAAPITEFDGKWSGRANPQVDGCIHGSYELMVKDGTISGTATFYPQTGTPRTSAVTGQVRTDKTAALALAPQGPESRRSRFQGVFDKDEFKASDPVVTGGRCAYEVRLRKAN